MWVFLNNAFVSVVAERRSMSSALAPRIGRKLLVRARLKGDIERALGVAVDVKETPAADYRYRATVTRRAFKKALRRSVDSIDYVNFKDSIGKAGPDPYEARRHGAYLSVWSSMMREQTAAHPPRDLEFGRDSWDRLMADRWDYRYAGQRELDLAIEEGTICPDCGCDLDRYGFCNTCGYDASDTEPEDEDRELRKEDRLERSRFEAPDSPPTPERT